MGSVSQLSLSFYNANTLWERISLLQHPWVQVTNMNFSRCAKIKEPPFVVHVSKNLIMPVRLIHEENSIFFILFQLLYSGICWLILSPWYRNRYQGYHTLSWTKFSYMYLTYSSYISSFFYTEIFMYSNFLLTFSSFYIKCISLW